MMGLGDAADIKWWYAFLTEECDLMIGRDWHWSWDHGSNCWAVEFADAKQETRVRLMIRYDS
jgi:hypothetical protein